MKEKCDKYEALFVFSSEDDFNKHLEVCPDCREQHMQMEKVAGLVKEVKPFVKRKSFKNTHKLEMAAGLIILFLGFLAISPTVKFESANKQNIEVASVKESSVITQMGLPTDDYGLLVVE